MTVEKKDFRNYEPERKEPETIGIIGGKGQMGERIADEFHRDGYKVIVTGIDEENGLSGRNLSRANKSLINHSDVVVFSLPIDVVSSIDTVLGTKNFRGWRDKLFIDVSSVQTPGTTELQKTSAAVIGVHPMFGPKVKNFEGQNVVINPVEPRGWQDWVENFWRERGATLHRMDPKKHDETVPFVQGAVVGVVGAYASILNKLKADLGGCQDLSTPNSRLMHALTGRMLDPKMAETYANLLVENPNNEMVTQALLAFAQELHEAVCTKDKEKALLLLQDTSSGLSARYLQDGSDRWMRVLGEAKK